MGRVVVDGKVCEVEALCGVTREDVVTRILKR